MEAKKFAQRSLLLLLQIAVTAAALYYIFHDAEKRHRMFAAFRQADWRWLVIGLGCYGVVETLATVRWLILLKIQGFHVPLLRAVAILFVGEFFTVCTPGLIGGDAMRIFYLARAAPEKKIDAGMLVLMDRIVGMIALISLATGVLAFRYHWLSHSSAAAAKLVHVMIAILGAGVIGLLLVVIVAKTGALARWSWLDKLRPVTTALHRYAQNWRLTVCAFVTTLVAHGFYYTTYCCAAHALAHISHPSPSFGEVFSVMPVVNTLVAMPISLGGLGVRESLFQVLLHDLTGTPEVVGVLIGMLGFSIQACWGIFGALAFLSYQFLARKKL